MALMASSSLRMGLIDIINRNNNVNYSIKDFDTIRFTLYMIYIKMNDGNNFNIKYDIMNSIENK